MSLQANNLTFQYFKQAKQPVIKNLSLSVEEGTITLLVGKSGSGKSTLAYLLAGIYPEHGGFLLEGDVSWKGVDLQKTPPSKRVSHVAKLFQNPDLQFCMNHLEAELEFCLENIGVPEAKRAPIVDEAIEGLGLDHLRRRNFHELSGGEKQKCALCCILALDAQCIILDEAFANIDQTSAREMIEILKASGKTVLAIDHNEALWRGAYDSIISLDGSRPKAYDMTTPLPAAGEIVLQVKDLCIRDIHYPDMQFQKGSVTAITGKSGAGKTSFFHSLMKAGKYEGELLLLGKDLKKMRKTQVFSKCGIVFQNPANQFLALSVLDEILFSLKRWYPKLSPEQKKKKALDLLERFGLARYQNYSPYLLSQGQQRRLAVLSMIAGRQEILLLDEPTYGQDYDTIGAMMELLLEKANEGLTIIYATHNEHLAKHFSHQIIEFGKDTTGPQTL